MIFIEGKFFECVVVGFGVKEEDNDEFESDLVVVDG